MSNKAKIREEVGLLGKMEELSIMDSKRYM